MKTFFSDIDLTLLSDDKSLCEANKNAVRKMLEAGHRIVLASGRSIDSVIKQAQSLELVYPGAYCIAYNGAEIYDLYEEKLLHKSELSCDLLEHIIADADEVNLHIQAYDDSHVIARAVTDDLLLYCSHVKADYKIVPDIAAYFRNRDSSSAKLLVIDRFDHDKAEAFRQRILQTYADDIDAFFSNAFYVEIVQKGTNKGVAVKKLCEILNIAHEDTVAAGDAMNDIPLLQAVHTGCAVKNADEDVKKIAAYITNRDNNEGAVAEIIDKFIL